MQPRPTLRRSRGRVAGAVLLTSVLCLTACGGPTTAKGDGKPIEGGTLNVLRRNPFEGFELDKESLNSTFQLSQAVLEPLVRSAADGKSLEAGLATEWTYNEDNTILTLKLDPDASFSNGEPVTPADVAFSVKTWQAGVNYGATYAGIETVEAVDEHTVSLHLAYPDTSLPAYLAWAAAGVVPKDFGGKDAAAFWQDPIGAGPFAVVSWSPEGKVVLERNAHYYEAKRPYVDEVVSTYAADANSVGLQLRSGQADIAEELLPVTAATLPEESVKTTEPHITPILLMNSARPALGDVHVRRAIGYAIDYDAILTSAFKGFGERPEGALPANSGNWAPPSSPYFSHDTTEAKAELAEAKTKPTTLTLSYPNDAGSALIAQIVQDNLKAIGITVKLQAADPGNNYATMSSGNYDLGIFSYNAISPDVSDPAVYVAATKGIFTGYDGGAIFDLVGKYAATADLAEKKKQVTAIQDLLAQDAPFLALGQTESTMGASDKVHGLEQLPWGAYYLDGIWKSS